MRQEPADIDDVARTLRRMEDEQLTKREKIAAMCLQGLLSNPTDLGVDQTSNLSAAEDRALFALQYADALIQALGNGEICPNPAEHNHP